MAEHNELGNEGEKIAQKYLTDNGYTLLATNWRFGSDELDIISLKDNQLVVTEVKTRSTNVFGEPEEFVTKTKQKFMIRAAEKYVLQNSVEYETRFDIISVLFCGGKYKVNHIEDAFSPKF